MGFQTNWKPFIMIARWRSRKTLQHTLFICKGVSNLRFIFEIKDSELYRNQLNVGLLVALLR